MVILSGPNFVNESQENPFTRNLLHYGGERVKVVPNTMRQGLPQALDEIRKINVHVRFRSVEPEKSTEFRRRSQI